MKILRGKINKSGRSSLNARAVIIYRSGRRAVRDSPIRFQPVVRDRKNSRVINHRKIAAVCRNVKNIVSRIAIFFVGRKSKKRRVSVSR